MKPDQSSKSVKPHHISQATQPDTTPYLFRQAMNHPKPETLTPAVLGRLQSTHGNQFVQRLIARSRQNLKLSVPMSATQPKLAGSGKVQRLKELSWKGGKKEEIDPDGPVTSIDISTLDYDKLHEYRTAYNYQQLDSKAYPNIKFEAGDIDAIDLALKAKESSEAAIKCYESEAKIASPTQGIKFGDVTTCMTITCILEDGSKTCAHDGMQLRAPGGVVAATKTLINGKKVIKVMAIGAGGFWDFDAKENKLKSPFEGAEGALIETKAHITEFEQFLEKELGGKAEFKNHESGSIVISPTGDYSKG